MSVFKKAILAGCLAASVSAPFAGADATYDYTGPNFTVVMGCGASPCYYSTSDRITGWMTLANPLPANYSNTNGYALNNPLDPPNSYAILAWEFTDGLHTWTSANSSFQSYYGGSYVGGDFSLFATNSSGDPSDWTFILQSTPTTTYPEGQLVSGEGLDAAYWWTSAPSHEIAEVYSSGTWQLDAAGTSPSTPEPASLILLGSGLAALAGWKRLRSKGN